MGLIEHLVLIRIKPGTTQQAIDDLVDNVKKLKDIQGVVSAYARLNLSTEVVNERYDICLRILLDSQEALAAYLRHPVHESFAKTYVRPIRDSVTVFDLEVTGIE